MGSSYITNHIHVVFSTKNRVRLIKEEIQPKLWAYMAGIAKNHGMDAVKIDGIEDHVHLLINLGGALGIIKAVQLIKARNGRFKQRGRRDRTLARRVGVGKAEL
jgi:putative transposase